MSHDGVARVIAVTGIDPVAPPNDMLERLNDALDVFATNLALEAHGEVGKRMVAIASAAGALERLLAGPLGTAARSEIALMGLTSSSAGFYPEFAELQQRLGVLREVVEKGFQGVFAAPLADDEVTGSLFEQLVRDLKQVFETSFGVSVTLSGANPDGSLNATPFLLFAEAILGEADITRADKQARAPQMHSRSTIQRAISAPVTGGNESRRGRRGQEKPNDA